MDHAIPARFLAAHEATAAAPISLLLRQPAPPPDHCAARLRRQLPPPRAGLRISVIIPAKDEAATLPAALAALAAQVTEHGQPLPFDSFEVIVLANNCRDATAAVVRRQAQRFPELVVHLTELCLKGDAAHVGRARRLLMDEACARLEQVGQPAGIIASTDADTQVAPTWLAAIQAEIATGADAVGGRIFTCDKDAGPAALQRIQVRDAAYRLLCARLEDLIDPVPLDRWPRHHQHFGASLALTAQAYRRVGGLPEVRFLEDEALCQELRRHDLVLRHSPRVHVITSARRQGRVEVGLSWQLSQWLHMSQQQREPHVENPVQLMRRWQLRRQLRACWAGSPGAEPDATIARLGLPVATVLAQMQRSATFGALWEWALAHSPNLLTNLVPLSQALLVLPRLIRSGVAAEWQPVG
ncbi:glycosyltransferase [Hymenobacter terrigena]